MGAPRTNSGSANYRPSPTCAKLVAVLLPSTRLLRQRSMLALAPVSLLVIPRTLKPTGFGTPLLLVFLILFTFPSQNTLTLLLPRFILVPFLALQQLPLALLHGTSLGLLHRIRLNQIIGHLFMTMITLLLFLTLLTIHLLR